MLPRELKLFASPENPSPVVLSIDPPQPHSAKAVSPQNSKTPNGPWRGPYAGDFHLPYRRVILCLPSSISLKIPHATTQARSSNDLQCAKKVLHENIKYVVLHSSFLSSTSLHPPFTRIPSSASSLQLSLLVHIPLKSHSLFDLLLSSHNGQCTTSNSVRPHRRGSNRNRRRLTHVRYISPFSQ